MKSAVLASSSSAMDKDSAKKVALQLAMRKLWEDHITWTRIFIISAAGDLPDKDAATQRLLQNQVDIGDAIKPYYGEAAGNKLTALLKEHITIVNKDPYGAGWLYVIQGKPDAKCVDVHGYRAMLDKTIDRILAKQKAEEIQ